MAEANPDQPWPQSQIPEGYEEEEENEEDQRDFEALLYSQIHHDQPESDPNQREFSVLSATHEAPVSPEPPKTTQIQDVPGESSDEEDDDGIMVLPRPQVVIPVVNLDSSDDETRKDNVESDDEDVEEGGNVSKIPRFQSTQVVDLVSSSDLSSGDDQDCVEEEIVIQGQTIRAQTRPKPKPNLKRSTLTITESTSEHSLTDEDKTDTPPSCPKSQKKLELRKKSAEVLQAYKAVYGSSDDSSEDERLSLGSGEVRLNLLGHGSEKSLFSVSTLDPMSAFKNCPTEDRPIRIHKWTDEMYQFYNEVNTTQFRETLDDIMQKIPDDSNWRVNRTDRITMIGQNSFRRGKSRYFDKNRCGNCKQMGHLTRHCPDPKKPLICNMCAARGHLRHACPNASCLRCSQPSYEFTSNCFHCRKLNKINCLECGAPGHAKQNCPDQWRRYHQTIEPGGVFQPNDHDEIHKSEWEMSCPNCAKEGHSLHRCRGFRPSSNPFPVLKVVSYKEPPRLDPEEPLISTKKDLKKWLRAERKAKKRKNLGGNEEESPVLAKKLKFLAHDDGDDLAARIMRDSEEPTPSKAKSKKARLALKAMAKWEKVMKKHGQSSTLAVDSAGPIAKKGVWAQTTDKFSKKDMLKFVKAIPLNEVPVLPEMALQKLKAQAKMTRKQSGGSVPHQIESDVKSQMTFLQRMIAKKTSVMSRDHRRNIKSALGSLKYIQQLVKGQEI